MRSTLFAIAILCCSPAWSDLLKVDCGACRDVYQHPRDFGNHAYNLLFSTQAVYTISAGQKVQVFNSAGQWAIVDLNFILQASGVTVNLGVFSIKINIPDGRVQIFVQDPRARITEYQALTDSPPLQVGDGSAPPPAPPLPAPSQPAAGNKSGGGWEIIDWGQEGAYYWYQDQPRFNLRFGGE